MTGARKTSFKLTLQHAVFVLIERAVRRFGRVLWALGAYGWFGVSLTLIACSQGNAGGGDSESHFLSQCASECGDELTCICGVCTLPCTGDSECASLAAGASCYAPDSQCEATSRCDLGCTGDADCASLGSGYQCAAGSCRAVVGELETTSQSDAGGASGAEVPPPIPSGAVPQPEPFPEEPAIEQLPVPPRRLHLRTTGPEPLFTPYLIEGDLIYQTTDGLSISRVTGNSAELVDLYPVEASAVGLHKNGDEVRVVFGSSVHFPNDQALAPDNPQLSARFLRFDVSAPEDIRLLEDRWIEGTIDGMQVVGDRVFALGSATGRVGRVFDLDSFELLSETPLGAEGNVLALGPDFVAIHVLGGTAPDNVTDITLIDFANGEWTPRGTARVDGYPVGSTHLQEGLFFVPTNAGWVNPLDAGAVRLLEQDRPGALFLADVLIESDLAYVTSFGSSHRFAVFDVGSGAATMVSEIETAPRLTSLTRMGDRLYGFGHDALITTRQAAVIDVRDPLNPTVEEIVDLDAPPPPNGITGRGFERALVIEDERRIGTIYRGGESPGNCEASNVPQAGVQWFSHQTGFQPETFVPLANPGTLTLIGGQPFNITGRVPESALSGSLGPAAVPALLRFAGTTHQVLFRAVDAEPGRLELATPNQATDFEITGGVGLPCDMPVRTVYQNTVWSNTDYGGALVYLDTQAPRLGIVHFDLSNATAPALLSTQQIPLATHIIAFSLSATHLFVEVLDPSAAGSETLRAFTLDPATVPEAQVLGGVDSVAGHGDGVLLLTAGDRHEIISDDLSTSRRVVDGYNGGDPLLLRRDGVLTPAPMGLSWLSFDSGTSESVTLTPPAQRVVNIDADRAFVVVGDVRPETQTWTDGYDVYLLSGLSGGTLALSDPHRLTLYTPERSVVLDSIIIVPGRADGLLTLSHDGANWTERRVETNGVFCSDMLTIGDQLVCNSALGVTLSLDDLRPR